MKEEKLYIAWQDPQNRSWWPVGLLTRDEKNVYRFFYTKGALKLHEMEHFEPFGNMHNIYVVYKSEDMFPLFSNRLLSPFRPEYNMYLKWLDIEESEDKSLAMLAVTEGMRGTDTLEVFKCPEPNKEGKFEVQFFVHGLRYLPKHCMDRVNELDIGDRLFIMLDVQNEFDYWALALRTEDPLTVVGYCPRYLTKDFYTILEKCEPSDISVHVEQVNRDAPLQLRLLCKIVAPWPKGFKACSGELYEPINVSKGKEVIEEMAKNQYRFGRSQETRVARSLRGKGATVKLSPGSRGAADVSAKFPSGRTWKIQVKATRGSSPASPARRDLGRLKQSASRSGATPVVAKVTPKSISYKSARSGKKLNP